MQNGGLQSGSEQEEACLIIQGDKTLFSLIKCVALAGKDTYIGRQGRIEEQKSMTENTNAGDLLALTTEIVAAHVSNNTVTVADLPQLINQVYQSLSTIGTGPAPVVERPQPAVNVKKSVFPDYIVCLEDGKKLKMLKRHLKTAYDLTPEEYRERWGLPADYPMVAPNYAQQRSKLAKEIGLGTRARRPGAA
jgi:predicted transcriptional regulator